MLIYTLAYILTGVLLTGTAVLVIRTVREDLS